MYRQLFILVLIFFFAQKILGSATVHTSHNLNVTRMRHAETTRVACACFCQKHAMTRTTNYLRVQGYMRLHHFFTHKVEFYTHMRVLAVIATRS